LPGTFHATKIGNNIEEGICLEQGALRWQPALFCMALLSYRTVDSIDYKKAMLIFYEQNNISPIKRIFIDQYKFAVNNYF
jgi:hypothetical protein